MYTRSKPRTSVPMTTFQDVTSFRSKAILQQNGYLVAKYRVRTDKGVLIEIGRAKTGIVAENSKAMFLSAELDAQIKVLYRQGFNIDKENYQFVESEHVVQSDLLEYDFYYLRDNNLKYENYLRSGKLYTSVYSYKDDKVLERKLQVDETPEDTTFEK